MCQNDEVLNQVVGICVSITLSPFLYVYLTYFLFKCVIKNFLDVQVKENKEKEEMEKADSLTTAAWTHFQEVSVQYSKKCMITMLCHPLLISLPGFGYKSSFFNSTLVKQVYNMGFHTRKL